MVRLDKHTSKRREKPLSFQEQQSDEALIIDLGRAFDSIKDHFPRILLATMLITACVGAYSFTLYQDQYRSSATILLNPMELPQVVSKISPEKGSMQPFAHETNPFKNQEELLKSRNIAKRVLARLKSKKIDLSAFTPDELQEKVLDVSHVKSTDLLKLSAVFNQPQIAQEIASAYTDSYIEMLREISYEPLKMQEDLYRQQLERVEKELAAASERLKTFHEKHGVVDLKSEEHLKVANLESMRSEIKELEATIAEKSAESKELMAQLDASQEDLGQLIASVAGGQNGQITNLQRQLDEATSEYMVKSSTYAASNPDMVQLQKKIETLESQITEQFISTVGYMPATETPAIIKDNLRAGMVDQLADNQARLSALQNKLDTRRHQVERLEKQLASLPSQQLAYARLLHEKAAKAEVLHKLQEKLSEVTIQKAAVQDSLVVIDPPALPQETENPNRFLLMALAGLVGCAASTAGVGLVSMVKPGGLEADFVESQLGIPVLSSIPWSDEKAFTNCRARNTLEVLSNVRTPGLIESYQSLALSLKMQRKQSGRNSLTIASLYQESETPWILGNLAYCLAQSGDRVLVVDTHLRNPKLHEVFAHRLDYDQGLPELINAVSEHIFRHGDTGSPEAMNRLIDSYGKPSGLHPQLFYLNAGTVMENTFEFLNAKGFSILCQMLKSRYDWVLFEAPPFMKHPDASVLLGNSDGLLLLIEQDSHPDQVRFVQKRISQLGFNIAGAVLRPPSQKGTQS